ncbi:MAG: DUF1799 domain-containing protein [Proteobacteria bacterium]|nr:DUF1799 domain-containing protein [Pseudomonadota bacterium]
MEGGGSSDDLHAAAAAMGLADQLTDLPTDPATCPLWPDSIQPVRLFALLLTQWRVSMAGLMGLDYAAVPVAARQLGLRGGHLKRALEGVLVMEAEALAWAREQRG